MLLFVIIVAFVFTIGATPGIGFKKERKNIFYGFNLASPKDINNLMFATQLTAELEQSLFQTPAQIEQALFARIITLYIADLAKVPSPTDEQVKSYIETLPIFQNEDKFSQTKYENMIKALESAGKTQSDIRKVFNDNTRIMYVAQTIGNTGVSFDNQVISALTDIHTEWTFIVAKYSIANYHETLTVTNEDAENFFKKEAARYVNPIKYKVSCIVSPIEKYLSSVERPTKDDLNAFALKHKEDFNDIEDKESAQKAIVTAFYKEQATNIARAEAEKLVINAATNDLLIDNPEIKSIIASMDGKIIDVPAYSITKLPEIDGLSSNIFDKVPSIGKDHRYSDPIITGNEIVIIYLEDVISGGQMSFEEAKQYVISDLESIQKHQLFAKYTEQVKQALSKEVAQGSDFEELAKNYGFSIEKFENVSISKNINQVPLVYFGVLGSMKNDKVQIISNGEMAYYIYLQNQTKPNINAFPATEISTMKAQIGNTIITAYRNSMLDELIMRGLQTLKAQK